MSLLHPLENLWEKLVIIEKSSISQKILKKENSTTKLSFSSCVIENHLKRKLHRSNFHEKSHLAMETLRFK